MTDKVISGRKLDRQPEVWLRWAKKNGPVVIKDHERTYVLLSHEDYETLQRNKGPGDAE